MTPSSPRRRAAASSASPSSKTCESTTTARPGRISSSSSSRRRLQGSAIDGLAVELEQVEDDVGDRALAALEELEARDAVLVERAQLAVEHAVGARERAGQRGGDGAVPCRRGACRCATTAARRRRATRAIARNPSHLISKRQASPAGTPATSRRASVRRWEGRLAWPERCREGVLGSPRAQACPCRPSSTPSWRSRTRRSSPPCARTDRR